MVRLKVMLKASGKKGVQGGAISPCSASFTSMEWTNARAGAEGHANDKYTYMEYARFADDLVIFIDTYKRLTGSSGLWTSSFVRVRQAAG